MSNSMPLGQQAPGIEFGQAHQPGAIIEQPGVEEVRAHAAGLGLEFTKAQHPALHGKLPQTPGPAASWLSAPGRVLTRHGKFLV